MSQAHAPLVVELMATLKQDVCVAWFADVLHPAQTGRRPQINVCLAQKRSDGRFQRHGSPGPLGTVGVPAAFLREFRIGDIWSGGAVVGSVPMDQVDLLLDIQPDTCEVVPCGRSFATAASAKTHELPFHLFNWHAGHTMAYVARVTISATELLVVPVAELIRFYFGSSGALLSRLFSGTGAMETLYTSKRWSERQRTGYLNLGPGLPGTSASAIGRIAFSGAAHKAARWIESSGATSASRKQLWYPRSTFPFTGKTNLRAEGVWADRGDAKVFIAFRLISCSHPFPYDRLFYWTEAHSSMSVVSQAHRRHGSSERGTSATASELNHGFPGNTDSVQPVPSAIVDVAFPDLIGKLVRRVRGKGSGGGASLGSGDSVVLVAGTGDSLERHTAEVVDPNMTEIMGQETEPPLILVRLAEAVDSLEGAARLDSGTTSSAIQPYQSDQPSVLVWWVMLTLFTGNRRLGTVVAVAGHGQLNEAVPLLVSSCPSDLDVCESLVAEVARSLVANAPVGAPYLRNQDQLLFNAVAIDAERFDWRKFLMDVRSRL